MADPTLGKPGEVHTSPEKNNAVNSNSGVSWASILGRNLVPTRSDSNVLEIFLEKESRGPFIVSDVDCANLMRRIHLDSRPGGQVEGVQICPNGRGVIYITLKKDVNAANYCSFDVLDVTTSGIKAVLIKPVGKKM